MAHSGFEADTATAGPQISCAKFHTNHFLCNNHGVPKAQFALVLTSVLAVAGCSAPYVLDRSTAQDILLDKRDFSFDMVESENQNDLSDTDLPIFNSSEDCLQDVDVADLIQSEGTILASSDFVNSEGIDVFVDQDIVSFDTVELAQEFVDLVRDGQRSASCEYSAESDSSSFDISFDRSETAEDVFGVQSDGSIVWNTRSDIEAKVLDLDLSSDAITGVIRKANYILYFKGNVYREGTIDASVRDVEADFVQLAERFVAGGVED